MSARYRSRRRRRSPLTDILLIFSVVILIFVLFRVFSSPEDTTSPPLSSSQPVETVEPSGSNETKQPEQPGNIEPPVPPGQAELPSLDEAPWQLTLANKDHPLPEDWEITTSKLPNGLLIDSRIYDALMAMLNDCKAEGLSPIVCSAYRTIERQTELFNDKIDDFMRDGLSYDEAYLAASQVVAIPGTSEHNLGLCVDICALDYQLLDDAQAETAEQIWLMEHCAEYGFILRYPKGKQDITGIIWEPWHYRYVGVELAKEISASGLCLEEYLALHYSGV